MVQFRIKVDSLEDGNRVHIFLDKIKHQQYRDMAGEVQTYQN